MNKYGLTEKEKAIWPPKKKELPWDVVAALVLLGIMLVGVFVYPSPESAHADEKVLSDKEQEALYCTQLATGEKKLVNEVSKSALAAHCARFN